MSHTDSRRASFYKWMQAKKACRFVAKIRTESGHSAPLSELFFCDHPECLLPIHPLAALRAIENYFCPQCLSTYPSNIVRKWTRCPKCIMCPACFTTCEKILLMRSNTYLLQCTFCYWLSGPVDIKAKTANGLVAQVKESNNKEIQKLKLKMFELVKHYKKNTEHEPSYMTKTNYLFRGSNWWEKKKRRRVQKQTAVQEQGGTFPGVGAVLNTNFVDPCNDLDKRLEEKRSQQHDLPKEAIDNSWMKPAEKAFVEEISLKRVTSLIHRLEDPMRQPRHFDKLHPQRLRLMTKESFKCPRKQCNQTFLCKPVIGARHCSFEVKKLALDYMPHVRLGWPDSPVGQPSGAELPPKTASKIHLYLANTLSDPIKIRVQPRLGDPFTNADVTCSPNLFELEHRDHTAKVVWPKLSGPRKQAGDDFTLANMCGIMLNVTPRYFHVDVVEFVLDVIVECQIICNDSTTRKTILKYPLEIQIKPPPPQKAMKAKSPRSKRSSQATRRPSGSTAQPRPTPSPSGGVPAAASGGPRPSASPSRQRPSNMPLAGGGSAPPRPSGSAPRPPSNPS